MARRAFVSGATGRVGGTLAKALVERGVAVSTLVLPGDSNHDALAATGIDITVGSLADLGAVQAAMDGADAVFHMAALISFQPQAREALWNANVVGAYNVFRTAATPSRTRDVRLVFASSDQVYPTRFARYRPTDENHPREPYSFYGLRARLDELIRAGIADGSLNASFRASFGTDLPAEVTAPRSE